MDYRADCDPRFQYIARSTPRSFGYTAGYLTGDGNPVIRCGISFPVKTRSDAYFLRIDYNPQILYRWDGKIRVRISSNVRTGTGFDSQNKSLLSGFINDSNQTKLTSGETISEAQALSTILTLKPDSLPPLV